MSGNTLNLLDTEPPDYSYNGSQYYTGTAPNTITKPMTFSGHWQQYAPTDTTVTPPGNHTRTATFTLTQIS